MSLSPDELSLSTMQKSDILYSRKSYGQGPVPLRRPRNFVGILAYGNTAFIESLAAIGREDCDSVGSLQ